MLGCFIISPLSSFLTITHFCDGILDADYEFDIIFWLWRHPKGAPRDMTSFFASLLYLENYLRSRLGGHIKWRRMHDFLSVLNTLFDRIFTRKKVIHKKHIFYDF